MKERSELVERALAMLNAVPSRRTAAPVTPASDWLSRWRELASITASLEADDSRLPVVLIALAECQHAHDAGDLHGFITAAAQVHRLMQFIPGASVRWEGSMNHRLCSLGPATVECVQYSRGRLWAWITWQDSGRWIADTLITQIEGPQ